MCVCAYMYVYMLYITYIYIFLTLSHIPTPHDAYFWCREVLLFHPLFCFMSALLFPHCLFLKHRRCPFYPRTLAHIWIAFPSLHRFMLVSFLPKSPVTLKMRVSLTSVSQTSLPSLFPSNTVLSFSPFSTRHMQYLLFIYS